ncbi:MAG: hypothetical protein K2M87_05830 [Muribaculaceae bacterium]|nr:hypothetical protein [Muribaculaceae bacterium]
MVKINRLLTAVLLTATIAYSHGGERDNFDIKRAYMALEFSVPENVIYIDQPTAVTVELVTDFRTVQSAVPSGEIRLDKGEFSTNQKVDYAGNPYEDYRDGRRVIVYPLETRVVSFADKGNKKLVSPEYKVALNIPTIINDPFWGPRRGYRTEERVLKPQSINIKVKDLPQPEDDLNFSGSVGEFGIQTILPKGDIFVNEEATVYIILRGTGLIGANTMPEYRSAFGEGIQLRSVQEEREERFDRGQLINELRLECTFIPTERKEIIIGETHYDFFNPVTKQYERVTSEPVKINVKSSTAKRERLEI